MRRIYIYLLLFLFFGPIFFTFFNLAFVESSLFLTFLQDQALGVLIRTIGLALCAVIISVPLGVFFAWLQSEYDYPFKNTFQWLILSPLAFPIYVLGFLYYDYFYTSYFLNFIGLVFSMSLGMIPYVYLLAYNNLSKQPQSLIEQSLFLNLNRWQRFIKIQLPLMRPALIGAIIVVSLEVFADFGTVSIFNYETFSVSIYKYWYRYFSFDTAKWISFLLILIILVINLIEWRVLKGSKEMPAQDIKKTKKSQSLWIPAIFSSYLFFAIVFPLSLLVHYSLKAESIAMDLALFKNTFLVCTYVSLFCLISVYILERWQSPSKWQNLLWIGYGIPGTFCAVAFVNPFYKMGLMHFGLIIMVIALSFRYIRLAKQNLNNGYQSISRSYLEASDLATGSFFRKFFSIEFPIYKSFYFSSFLFVFIEVMKEMPIQLMTRPFDWYSFSTKIYEYTSEAQWEKAAPIAIVLCLFGMIPILLMNHYRRAKYETLNS